jgi:hypothetical protein
MNFTKLHDGISCDCLEDTHIDIKTPYFRRIANITPTSDDFISWYEMGKKPKDTCEDICGFRGVSIYICSEKTKDVIITKQKKAVSQRKRISPMAKIPEFGYLFKLKEAAGKIKQSGPDSNHYDLYKCDEFTLDCLSDIEIINLVDVQS